MENQKFDTVITSKRKFFSLNLKEVAKYKDLIWLFVQRDLKTRYKQTILGPIWFVIQPLLTTIVYTVIFGTVAGLAAQGVPSLLFFMIGNVTWTFFASCLNAGIGALRGHAGLFSKVYFPRLVPTISTMIMNWFNFLVQFIMYMGFTLYFFLVGDSFTISYIALLTPLVLIQLMLVGMGVGLLISSVTTKYRDFNLLIGFGISAWMYLSPVIYDAATQLGPTAYTILMFNPVAPGIEILRAGWLGCGSLPFMQWGVSWGISILFLLLGVLAFNKTEKNFLDTI